MVMWLVRAGRAGENEAAALRHNAAIVGWESLPDLTPCTDRDTLMGLLRTAYPGEQRKTLASWQNQIWPIREAMQTGDLVALPLKSRPAIAFGTVSGGYAYRDDVAEGGRHTRPVKWTAQVPRSEFDPDLLFSFGAFLTVCRIARNDAEERIRTMLSDEKWTMTGAADGPARDTAGEPARDAGARPGNLRPPTRSPVPLTVSELEAQSNRMIRDRIAQRFKGHHLAGLVAAILEAKGYTVRVSPPGVDGGVDILAGTGPLGFDAPRLAVQVKSQDARLDVRVLRELSGVMTRFQAEQGLLVGWGGFNQMVRAEAASDYFRVRLWDADDLVRAIVQTYGELPLGIRSELPLRQVWTLAPESRATAA